jgi:hypothetical protein
MHIHFERHSFSGVTSTPRLALAQKICSIISSGLHANSIDISFNLDSTEIGNDDLQFIDDIRKLVENYTNYEIRFDPN